jgi:hypothetical protein
LFAGNALALVKFPETLLYLYPDFAQVNRGCDRRAYQNAVRPFLRNKKSPIVKAVTPSHGGRQDDGAPPSNVA